MIGPGSQIGFSGVGVPAAPGALSILAPVNGGTAAVNLTTEGTQDWLAVVSTTSGLVGIADCHWKMLGGFIRDSFQWVFRNGTNTSPNQADSFYLTSATDPDDARVTGTQAAPGNLANNAAYAELLSNNALPFINWGFRLRAKAAKVTRQLNLYLMVSSGGAAINGAVTIKAHLSDNSAPDVSVVIAPGVAGHTFWRVAIPYNAHTDGAELVISALVSTYGDNGTAIGFIAATQQ